MRETVRVAIDGPSGAGKSTIAKKIAQRLSIEYIDTGAMYRAVGYKAMIEGIKPDEETKIKSLLDNTEIDFVDGNIILDGKIINEQIRTPEISKQASGFSAIGMVRSKLVDLQRKMGESKSIIMDGRDIGTNVLPDAEYKFFVTATAEERADRRYKELAEKGQKVDYDSVLADIIARDHNDSTRKINPLKMADDAVLVDTTEMTIDQVVAYICKEMENNGSSKTL